MKYKKILLLLLLIAAFAIILFPPYKKLNLDGVWTIDKVTVNAIDNRIAGVFIISDNHLTIQGDNLITNEIEEADFKIEKDSVKIKITNNIDLLPVEEINYSGNYKINISNTLDGSGDNAAFNYQLVLKSKDVSIHLSRIEKIKWNKGVQRGRP